MRYAPVILISAAVAAVSACATAPSSSTPSRSSAAPTDMFAPMLRLCDGDHIDNAPATDAEKRVLGYLPFADVAGAKLARAPVRGACFASGFGRRHDRPGHHNGVDLLTGHPHVVYAAGDGVIEEMRVAGGYGNMILIRHNSRVQTRYAHLSAYASNMHIGHKVRQGDVIGRTGSTGNAESVLLHYEIIVDGAPRDPMTVGRQGQLAAGVKRSAMRRFGI